MSGQRHENGDEPEGGSFFDRTPTISKRLQGGRPAGGKGRASGFRGGEGMGMPEEDGENANANAGEVPEGGGEEEEEPSFNFNRTFSLTGKGGQPRHRRGGMRERPPIQEESIDEGNDWEPPQEAPFSPLAEGGGEDQDPEEFFGRTMTLGNKPRFQSQPPAPPAPPSREHAPGSRTRPSRGSDTFGGTSPGAGRSMTLGERKQAQQDAGFHDGSTSGVAFKKASSLAPGGTRTRAEAGLYGEDSEEGALEGRQFLPRYAAGGAGEAFEGQRGRHSRRDPENYPMLPLPGEPQVVECQKCGQLLEVPEVLPPAKKGVQKLRCGTCLRVSRFRISPSDPRGGGYPGDVDGAYEDGAFATQDTLARDSRPWGGANLDGQQEQEGGVAGEEQGMEGGSYHDEEGMHGAGEEGGDESQGGEGGGRAEASGQGMFEDEGMGAQAHLPSDPEGGQEGAEEGEGGEGDAAHPRFDRQVVVNGGPVSDDVVRAAEQRAGPIHPGNYWYDEIAGFWGAMGGPCLGIVPPGIEFGHELPRECAGGTTGVVVNGRELHKKDLERLKKRGLPATPDAVYRIEIAGNVFDWESGEFLMGLGKLAPSLESRKRGGGMKMPGS